MKEYMGGNSAKLWKGHVIFYFVDPSSNSFVCLILSSNGKKYMISLYGGV